MGRLFVIPLRCALVVSIAAGGAALWAASSVITDASMSIVAPGAAITQQEAVTGAITLPLVTNIGASALAGSLPLPQSFSGIGQVRIGTESIERDIAQVISRAGLQQASFTIIGDRDQVISITVPPSISLERRSGEGQVGFSPVTSLMGDDAGGGRLMASADGTGELAFDVGGRVEPSPAATAGEYAGVLRVTVQYN